MRESPGIYKTKQLCKQANKGTKYTKALKSLAVTRIIFIFAAKKTETSMSQRQNMSKANKRKVYLKASDFLLDMAKLVFAGIILTGLMNFNIEKIYLFLFGITLTVVLSIWGYILFVRGIKTN